jgi:addiction module RelE/StbE family toxin
MALRYLPKFKRQYKKLPRPQQAQFDDRLRLFVTDPTDVRLRLHPLKGRFAGYWSINISGDLRALFYREGEDVVVFALIGTHSHLYG